MGSRAPSSGTAPLAGEEYEEEDKRGKSPSGISELSKRKEIGGSNAESGCRKKTETKAESSVRGTNHSGTREQDADHTKEIEIFRSVQAYSLSVSNEDFASWLHDLILLGQNQKDAG